MDSSSRWPTVILATAAPQALQTAMSWLRQGELVAFPTDTVYGLGAPMDDLEAVDRLFRVKERPYSQGIPLLLAEAEDVERVCCQVPESAWRLVRSFWPGGLSLVLWRGPSVADLVTGGRPTVAVRLPAHPCPRELARQLRAPLVATSANRSGFPSPTTAADVWAQLAGRIPLILDGGACAAGRPSTIVDLTVDPPLIVRVGPVSRRDIEAVLGCAVAEG